MDPLLVNAETLVREILISSDDLASLIDDRVCTAIPAYKGPPEDDPRFPLIRVTRVAGAPASSWPLRIDRPMVQLDSYAGPKATALTVLETARQVLAGARGTWDAGVVSRVRFGPLSWQPEPDFQPAPSRYRCDVTLTTHPLDTTST